MIFFTDLMHPKLEFLGAADGIGSQSLYIDCDSAKILIDYGLTPTDPPEYPLPSPKPDIMLLTHCHLDHSGTIPVIAAHYDAPIICSSLTLEATTLLLKDSLKVAKNEGYSLPYTLHEIEMFRQKARTVNFGKKLNVNEVSINVHSAGHIPGALMFEIVADKTLLFTSDLHTIDMRLVSGAKPVKCDTLLIESTYAGREHPNRKELEKQFIDDIDDVNSRGGLVLIPCFAVSRTQEIMMILADQGMEIYLDGMGQAVNRIYKDYPQYLRSPEKFNKALNKINLVRREKDRKKALSADVIITTSGMLDGGPVLEYLLKIKESKRDSLFLTGYQVEGSNGRKLLDTGKIEISGISVDINCPIKFFDFSAHAGHSELIDFIYKCAPENVIFMHGYSREMLKEHIEKDFNVILPQNGVTFVP